MTDEMLKDQNYTIEQHKDDISYVYHFMTGVIKAKIDMSQDDAVKEELQELLDTAKIELEDRYQKRKKWVARLQ